MTRLDDVNLQILHLLQSNGRISLVELAAGVGRSESTVRERVSALEVGGYIQGYEARVDWVKAGLPATAVVRAHCDFGALSDAARTLHGIPHCTGAWVLTGPKPVVAVLRVRDAQHLHSILRDNLAETALDDVEADLALESLVPSRPPAFPGRGPAPPPAPRPAWPFAPPAPGLATAAHASHAAPI